MLLNGKQEGQILLLALLLFPCSGAGISLLHSKRKRNKEHCLSAWQTTAQSCSGGTAQRETTGTEDVSSPAGRPIAMQPPMLKHKDLEQLCKPVHVGRWPAETPLLYPSPSALHFICLRSNLQNIKQRHQCTGHI